MLKNRSLKTCFNLAFLVIVLDQITKAMALMLLPAKKIAISPHLNFALGFNKGAAFGILDAASGWQRWFFIGLGISVSIVILIWSMRLSKGDKWENVALALILGGAWGNLIDRIRLGHVVDFIDFYIGNWHWYTFNVADIAICVGAFLLAIYGLRK
jgi:signal peptidase II